MPEYESKLKSAGIVKLNRSAAMQLLQELQDTEFGSTVGGIRSLEVLTYGPDSQGNSYAKFKVNQHMWSPPFTAVSAANGDNHQT